METKLLKLIKNSMKKQNIDTLSYPNIDRLCLKYYPELVFENKLSSIIKKLLENGLIKKSEKGGGGNVHRKRLRIFRTKFRRIILTRLSKMAVLLFKFAAEKS